jgi:hypothetical protein
MFAISDMSVLNESVFFAGAEEVTNNDLGKIKVTNFDKDVDEALTKHFGWQGTATAAVGLILSPDNLQVQRGVFITRGDLEQEQKKMPANSIWPAANPNISIHLSFPSANVFQFDSGGLWSNIVPSTQVPHTFYDSSEGRVGKAIISTDVRLKGTEAGFSIRMVAQISKRSNATLGVILQAAIMLFPVNAEDLSNIPESKFPGWPGLKIGEVFLPLNPQPTAKWKCPVLPFLRQTTPFQEGEFVLSSNRLRDAITGVMRNVQVHHSFKLGAHVLVKWAAIRSNFGEMLDKSPAISWPESKVKQEEYMTGE